MNDEIPDDAETAMKSSWKAFRERYPLITSENRFKRIISALFIKQTEVELSYINGFYRGWLEALKQQPGFVPPEPISGQPESPGSHSS